MKEVFMSFLLPQHKAKKVLNRYIRNKKTSGLLGLYYKHVRDRIAIHYHVTIGLNTKIDGYVNFPHPMNIVIGDGTRIGTNCTIYNNVTIGQKRNQYPVIGDNVVIYPGATIIGPITIGNNVIIGANSLVCKSVPDGVIVAGNPAKVIIHNDR